MDVKVTRVFIENFEAYCDKRIRFAINEGGTSSSKTYSTIQLLIDIAKNSSFPLEISIVSESMPHLKRGCIRDFKNILGADYKDRWFNKTDYIYRFPNGSYIEFFSADNAAKCRGPRRDILYINECNNVSKMAFDEMEVRTRMFIFLDFNPVAEFWAHDMQGWPNVRWVHSTYLDARHVLPLQVVKSIESRKGRDPNWWRIYGLGEVGIIEGLVHPHFKQCDALPTDGRRFYGIDWGYSNDPTSLIECVYVAKECAVYSDQLIYEKGLKNNQIANRMKQMNVSKLRPIWADSADPKSIDEIYSYGFNIKPIEKPLIETRVQFVNQFELFWTKRSLESIKEQRNYRYLQDKNGKWLNEPIDDWNHSMDARGYAMWGDLFRPGIDYKKFVA